TDLFEITGQSLYNLPWAPSSRRNRSIGVNGRDRRMAASLEIHTIVSMPFAVNTYIVWAPPRRDAVLIDPGLEPEQILEFLGALELTLAVILNTHGHADHIGGNERLKAAYPDAPLIIGANEQHLLTDANANLSAPFGMPTTSPPADRVVYEGESIEAAGI